MFMLLGNVVCCGDDTVVGDDGVSGWKRNATQASKIKEFC